MNQYMKKFSVASSLVLYKDFFAYFKTSEKLLSPPTITL